MATFQYRAVSHANEQVSGQLEAPDRAAAISRLRAKGFVPLAAAEVRPGSLRAFLGRDLFRRRLSGRALAEMLAQLASLVAAEVPLEQAVTLLARDERVPQGRQMMEDLLSRLRGGAPLSEAMAASNVFPRIAVAMVRAGEASGALAACLTRLAEHMARTEAVRETIRSALVYPAVMLVVAFGSVGVILTVVLPQLRPLFAETGAKMPLTTSIVFAASDIACNDGWYLLAATVGTIWMLRRAWSNARFTLWRDRTLLRLPLIGTLVTRAEAARFARTLGALVGGGVPLPAALALARPVLGNVIVSEAAGRAATEVKEGGGLAAPLAKAGVFPALMIDLLRIGEATAKLDEMLTRAAEIFETDVQRAVARSLTLLVPALTLGLGALVAGIIASVMVAILGVNDLVR